GGCQRAGTGVETRDLRRVTGTSGGAPPGWKGAHRRSPSRRFFAAPSAVPPKSPFGPGSRWREKSKQRGGFVVACPVALVSRLRTPLLWSVAPLGPGANPMTTLAIIDQFGGWWNELSMAKQMFFS